MDLLDINKLLEDADSDHPEHEDDSLSETGEYERPSEEMIAPELIYPGEEDDD